MRERPSQPGTSSRQDSQTAPGLLRRLSSCSIGELLAEIERLGIRLTLADGRELELRDPEDRLTPEHRLVLERREPQIRAHLRGQRLLTGEEGLP